MAAGGRLDFETFSLAMALACGALGGARPCRGTAQGNSRPRPQSSALPRRGSSQRGRRLSGRAHELPLSEARVELL